jgi:hypothetical protein
MMMSLLNSLSRSRSRSVLTWIFRANFRPHFEEDHWQSGTDYHTVTTWTWGSRLQTRWYGRPGRQMSHQQDSSLTIVLTIPDNLYKFETVMTIWQYDNIMTVLSTDTTILSTTWIPTTILLTILCNALSYCHIIIKFQYRTICNKTVICIVLEIALSTNLSPVLSLILLVYPPPVPCQLPLLAMTYSNLIAG